jgi:hypothetical protein
MSALSSAGGSARTEPTTDPADLEDPFVLDHASATDPVDPGVLALLPYLVPRLVTPQPAAAGTGYVFDNDRSARAALSVFAVIALVMLAVVIVAFIRA